MDYAYRVFRGVKTFYNTINPATLSGAIDVIVVEQPDGEYKSTPFHVRFGKYGVFSHSDKYVDIMVNGTEIDLKMKLSDSGVAYFVEETTDLVPEYLIDSPVPESSSRPDVDAVLAASVQKLDSDSEANTIKRKSFSGRSDKKEEQSLSQVQRASNLPFSPSVFSDRRYRSLPDLRVISDRGEQASDDDLKTADDTLLHNKKRPNRRPLHHSKSQAFEKRKKSSMIHGCSDKVLKQLAEHGRSAPPTRRKKSQRILPSAPISIGIEDSDSELDSSVSSSTASSPSPSMMDGTDHDQSDDHHADGALSDSEVDRHRNTPDLHSSRVTDWQWGQLPETFRAKSWSWFNWGGKSRQPEREEGITLDELMNGVQNDPSKVEKYLGTTNASVSVDSGNGSRGVSQPSSPGATSENEAFAETVTPTQETVDIVPATVPKKMRTRSGQISISSNDDLHAFSEDDLESIEEEGGGSYIRSLRLSSDKLKSLGLVRGANECRFSITTKFQGTCWCICNIYLYKWYEQIVISDIDGTITKSDVLGHVIPAIGGTWAHTGVAELYTRIKNNGYKMVYLSSRAIGQSHTTKQYLKSVAQDSRQLPDGPVLLSPTSVLLAFRREVIERKPEEFKIAALSDLKKLFPVSNPFFAGFGNRETDVTSYRAVDVPPARILIIDPSGRVRRSDSIGYVSSYSSMATETVDYLFPPISRMPSLFASGGHIHGSGWARSDPLNHSSYTHWSLNSRDVSDNEIAEYEKNRKATGVIRKKK